MNIGEDAEGIYVDVPDPAQIPTRDAQAAPAQLFVERVAEMLVAAPADGIDSVSVNIATCILIQSGLYANDDAAVARNDAVQLLKSFPSRPASEICSEFLEKRLMHAGLSALQVIQGMQQAWTEEQFAAAAPSATDGASAHDA